MNILEMKPHPLALAMPKLKDHETNALRESMKEQGFDPGLPVVVWFDPKIGEDRILDGVNRRDMAKELKLDRIPIRRFEGDLIAAIRFVHGRQFGRRNCDASQRAFGMASMRKDLRDAGGPNIPLEEAAREAGVSLSQMEKASAIAHKSKHFTAKGLRGEISVNTAAERLKRTIPESHTTGEDPWKEIQKTIDRMTAAEEALEEWAAEYLDPLLDRRGAEMLQINVRSRGKVVHGRLMMGQSLVEEIIQTIRRNKPKGKCPDCKGAGCATCKERRYITAHEEAMIRNERNGVTK